MKRNDFLKAAGATGMLTEMNSNANDEVKLRFGMVTDPHYAETDTRGTRFYRESAAKITECIEFMNREQVEFLIELGDFKDEDDPGIEANTLEYLKTIESVFARFNGPRYHVLGNHDLDSLSKEQFQAHVENTGIPKEQTYYSFNYSGIHFIVLDANFTADGTPYDHSNFEWTDTWVPPTELAWLQKDLANTTEPVIVFTHQLLDGDDAYCIKNAAEVRNILEKHGRVLAVFQGHKHAGDYNQIAGIHYYTLKAMIEESGAENSAYAIVEIHHDLTLAVKGLRHAVTRQLN